MDYLRGFRESRNLNQKQLSEELGFSKSYYSLVERGLRHPSYTFLKSLKELFGDDIDLNGFFK